MSSGEVFTTTRAYSRSEVLGAFDQVFNAGQIFYIRFGGIIDHLGVVMTKKEAPLEGARVQVEKILEYEVTNGDPNKKRVRIGRIRIGRISAAGVSRSALRNALDQFNIEILPVDHPAYFEE